MATTLNIHPALTIAAAPVHHSKLLIVMLSLAAASLIADAGLLVGAVLIR
jgi:hypothetical protein